LKAREEGNATSAFPWTDTMTDHTHKLATDAVLAFLKGGKATVTLLNLETEGRHTYRLNAPGETAAERREAGIVFVSVLTGPENTSHYTYIGVLVRSSGEFKLTKGSRLPMSDKRVAGFSWLARQARNETLDRFPHVEVRHHNHCGACGRKLTTPRSIDSGLGPICARRLGVAWVREDERKAA